MSDFELRRSPPPVPTRLQRVLAVWCRHARVYQNSFFSNATPAVLEPVFMLLAIGLGVGRYVQGDFNGQDYVHFMAPGILGMATMYTAAFEASYAAFIRIRWQKTYEAMLATPITRLDIFVGELLWCSTKGLFFGTIVGAVLLVFGVISSPWMVLVPVAGFFTAMAFAGLSYIVTSFVKTIDQFQYYFTVVLTPLLFFSGMMFPVQDLPYHLAYVAYALPMFHVIETYRLITQGPQHASVEWVYWCPVVTVVMAISLGVLGVIRMMGRLRD